MFKKLLTTGKRFFTSPQDSVLSAASLIMFMVVASRVLGLVRQRVLAHFFVPEELSLFFAAFRLPDLVFEVLVFGTFSSAFIPVFTRLQKLGGQIAWKTAGIIVNLGLLVFLVISGILSLHAEFIYSILAPGYVGSDRETIVGLARVLFAAQGFFVISYVLTGVLESLRRFLVPALAPLFYNVGIILGTYFLSPTLGLMGPALGVVFGALAHFLIQLPLAIKMGFKFSKEIKLTPEVRKIGKLAAPRILETAFLQVSKTIELFFSSLISVASYTYYTFGNSIQLLPVGLFGTSIAKAALPTLAREAGSPEKFKKTLLSALYDMCFFIVPFATILVVLRVPLVRLIYGTDIFGWEATIQTGYVVSAFALGVVFQASNSLLSRSFYAVHDTRTPVIVSISTIAFVVILDFVFIRILNLDVWSLALAFSIGSTGQAATLLYLMNRRLGKASYFSALRPIVKSILAALGAGSVMYFLLRIFDRSAWIKQLSFLGAFDNTQTIPFERFVLDTRYTVNLIILTVLVSLIGGVTYIVLSVILKSEQVWNFFNLLKRLFARRKAFPIPVKEEETVSPSTSDSSS